MLARRFTRFISTSSSLRQQLSVSSESDLNILLGKIQLPQVDRLNEFNTQNKGLPGIFSQSTLNDIWYDQLNHKLEDIKYIFQSLSHHDYSHCFNDSSLNENTSNKVINQYKNLLSDIAKRFDPNESYLFDSTASIYNLYYFLSSLKSSTSPIPTLAKPDSLITFKPSFKSCPLNSDLVKLINKSFGSIEEFQTLLFHSAASIKGNGYTWLTYNHIDASTNDFNKLSHLSILNTYNSGIPLNFTNRRISNGREHDKRVSGESETNSSIPNLEDAKFNNVNEFQITPLFAIGSNPSFWLRDYGVFGKKQYVNNVINAIDWEIVENRLPSK